MRRQALLAIFTLLWAVTAQAQWSGQFAQRPEFGITAFAPIPGGFVAAGSPLTVLDQAGNIQHHVLRFYQNGRWTTAGDSGASILFSGGITTVHPYRNDFCVGGGFTQFSAGNFNYFACYSVAGDRWYQPGGDGNGPNLPVNDIWFDGSVNLYIAGEFFEVSDAQGMALSANSVARTTGAEWEVLSGDGGTSNGVASAAQVVRTFNGFVFVAHGNQVSRFNPTTETWLSYGSAAFGVTPRNIVDLSFFDNEVVSSGAYDSMGGISAPGVASTPVSGAGPDWMPLDDGSQGPESGLFRMAANSSFLYIIGGWPTLMGTDGLARWTGMVYEAVDTSVLGDMLTATLLDVATLAGGDICLNHQGLTNSALASQRVVCRPQLNGDWRGVSQGIEGTVVGAVNALQHYAGQVYAAGEFLSAGDSSRASSIASWDGSQWSEVGAGITGEVNSLAVFDNELYASGAITAAEGNSTGQLIAYNGTSWRGVGGTSTLASELQVFNDDLYFFGLGGNCGTNLLRVCRFDGNSIEEAASGLPEPVSVDAMAIHNDELIVAGNFSLAGGARENVIAALRGGTWTILIRFGNTGSRALALASDVDNLYFGGSFTSTVTATNNNLNNIARWDGSNFFALGDGVGGGTITRVLDIEVRGSQVFVAGDFDTAGGNPAGAIAAWDGNNWDALDGGLQRGDRSGVANAMASAQEGLYVGGFFHRSGEQWGENIALLLGDVVYANSFEDP